MYSSGERRLVLRDEKERIVMGEVYIPNFVDTFGTTMTPEEVKRVAYDFMRKGLLDHIDEMHNYQKSGNYVVESFIARKGDPDFVEGSWVIATKIENDEVWKKILNGEYNGYSIAGRSNKQRAYVSLSKIKELEVESEENLDGPLPPHVHRIHLIFNDDHRIFPTWTDTALDHAHEVLYTTATERELDHSHRFVVA
jgi:hypothetical protein